MYGKTTKINVPPEWESTSDWDSHRPALYLALKNAKGTVVELGCGDGSTPLLEKYCNENNIPFKSFDTDRDWASKYESTELIDDVLNVPVEEVGLLFVDSKPAETRKDILEKWAWKAKIIVAHDSEEGSRWCYNMEETLSGFYSRIDYAPEGNPNTTIVSNFINLLGWISQP